MSWARVILIIISILGFVLNNITLYITGSCLQFNGIDIKLVSVVAVFDILVSVTDLVRIVALEVQPFASIKVAIMWCTFDSTIILTLSQTAIETVALLGIIRYFSICYNKQYRSLYWVFLIILSFTASLAINLSRTLHPENYNWSKSVIFCFPINESSSTDSINFIWDILTVFRIFLSLFIISFSYYKVSIVYRKILEEQIDLVEIKENGNEQSDSINTNASKLRDQVQRQHKIISIQLLGVALLYIICVAPVEFNIIYRITTRNYTAPNFIIFSQLFYSTTIIINPLFVLISHKPSRRELIKLFYQTFQIKSTPDNSEPYPYPCYQ